MPREQTRDRRAAETTLSSSARQDVKPWAHKVAGILRHPRPEPTSWEALHDNLLAALGDKDGAALLAAFGDDPLVCDGGENGGRARAALLLRRFLDEYDVLELRHRVRHERREDGGAVTTLIAYRILAWSTIVAETIRIFFTSSLVWSNGDSGWRLQSIAPYEPLRVTQIDSTTGAECYQCGSRHWLAHIHERAGRSHDRVRLLNPLENSEDAAARRFALVEID